MIPYFIQVTVCLSAFYLLYHVALRRETFFHANRFYLLFTLIVSLVMPFITIPIGSPVAELPVVGPAMVAGTYLHQLPEVLILSSAESSVSSQTDWLLVPYGAVAGLLAARFLQVLYGIYRLWFTGRRARMEGQWCVISSRVQSPFSFGRWIFLPEQPAYASDAFDKVLQHERAHVRLGHTADILLVEIIRIFLWACPPVYLYRRALREVHEYAADAEVLRRTTWEPYARLLMAQQYSGYPALISHMFNYSQLKSRIQMMRQRPSSTFAGMKYFGILPAAALILAGFSFQEGPAPLIDAVTDQFRAEAPAPVTQPTARMPVSASSLAASPVVDAEDPVMPVFPGCSQVPAAERAACSGQKLMAYVAEHLRYPASMRKSGLEGKVVVRFVVTKEGWVSRPEVVKSLSPEADEAALALVQGMNDQAGAWIPGTKDGRPADLEMTLPIRFALGTDKPAEVLMTADQMPRFPGCESLPEGERGGCAVRKMMEFVSGNLRYPAEDRKQGIEGTAIVSFVVGRDGRLRDIELKRGLSQTIGAEVMRVMELMKEAPEPWIPGVHEGEPVDVMLTLPFSFKLSETDKAAAEPRGREDDPVIRATSTLPVERGGFVTVPVTPDMTQIVVADAVGKQILSLKTNTTEQSMRIETGHLPAGKYIISAATPNGPRSWVFVIAE